MLNDAPNGGDSRAMPCDAGQPAPCGPAAVAVHDDGHMQFFVNVTLHSTVTSHNVALRVPSPAASLLLLAKSPPKYAVPLFFIAAPTFSAEFLSYAVSFGTSGAVCCAAMPGTGREPYQSILRVKYMAAATARKPVIAPTSSALSSSRSSR
jgi:hypothetical protein